MTTCIKCGKEIPDGELFCAECGLNPECLPEGVNVARRCARRTCRPAQPSSAQPYTAAYISAAETSVVPSLPDGDPLGLAFQQRANLVLKQQ